VVDARVQRAIAAQREPLAKLGQTEEDGRQQSAAVPGVIGEDVQMVERVLVEQVRLVELCGAPHNSTHVEPLVMCSACAKPASLLDLAADDFT
jgi:hypothetical protein